MPRHVSRYEEEYDRLYREQTAIDAAERAARMAEYETSPEQADWDSDEEDEDMQPNALMLTLRACSAVAPDDDTRTGFASMVTSMRGEGRTEEEIITALFQAATDGLAYGNWLPSGSLPDSANGLTP